ncbi:sigma-70 family RNA polymerase sigma factor [Cohnella sp. GbtcB17]|uniref:sigma-70 family RNA polymerase sigma factor n=1 Tax=Cohnella sp. GbtcB17 TaxID=2824762 RepID=UPI001C2FDE0D|nr:sigma-70 family RNA polymerase sigma factor [Cohnella sp. GbtcB17]
MNDINPELYLHIVKPIAGKLNRRTSTVVRFDDMVGIGNVALVRAAKVFDPAKDVPFEKFAAVWIAGAIRNYIRDHGGPGVKPPRTSRDRWNHILHLGIQDKPDAEIASELGCEVALVAKARADAHVRYLSLDLEVDGEPVTEVADHADWTSIDVGMFLDTLNPQEREVLELRMADVSQAEIARRCGVSQMHISRTLRRIGAKYLKKERFG